VPFLRRDDCRRKAFDRDPCSAASGAAAGVPCAAYAAAAICAPSANKSWKIGIAAETRAMIIIGFMAA